MAMEFINRMTCAAVMAVCLVSCGDGGQKDSQAAQEPAPEETAAEASSGMGFSPEDYTLREGKVRRGEFFADLLMKLGMDAQGAYNLSSSCDTSFDVRSLRVGNPYRAYYGADTLKYLVYGKNSLSDVVFKCTEPYSVWQVDKPVTVEHKYADVTIEHSLWEDMLEEGVSPLLILSLSDIYAWTVDFFGLQRGDRFRVFYDQKLCEGNIISIDTVRYAVFSHGGEDFPMVMFNQGDGGNIYWNEKGESMRKAFLKAPLSYSRISSGFSYSRRHPITRKVQPHTGVDYAAPKGTPVMTIGDGIVTSMKNEGAGGNVVRIKHNSVYRTAYLHLSKFASGLAPGKRVRQGEVIGYVGSTGRSTGPHLDFRVWKNGTPVNPLKMESPPAEPVKDGLRPAFEAAVASCRSMADSLKARELASEIFEFL